jgi:hypothetical protein
MRVSASNYDIFTVNYDVYTVKYDSVYIVIF